MKNVYRWCTWGIAWKKGIGNDFFPFIATIVTISSATNWNLQSKKATKLDPILGWQFHKSFPWVFRKFVGDEWTTPLHGDHDKPLNNAELPGANLGAPFSSGQVRWVFFLLIWYSICISYSEWQPRRIIMYLIYIYIFYIYVYVDIDFYTLK